MTTLELVDTEDTVTVSVTMPAVHECPFRNETDEGTATLEWTTVRGQTVELHSLRTYLDSLDEWVVSHEDYTCHLWSTLVDAGLSGVTVTTTWSTAGGTVKVTA